MLKHNYITIIIHDPYNNRKLKADVAKRKKGVYVWETLDSKNIYVGHSNKLYNRIIYYFMPSILNSKTRRVFSFLNKHGFSNIKLTI